MPTVAVVIYDEMWTFDYGIAVEMWGIDRSEAGVPRFEFRRCGVGGRAVSGHAGTSISATHDLAGLVGADMIIAPGRDHHTLPLDPTIGEALRAAHERGVRIVGMCGGAFTLAQAGLLNGLRATTHWLLADDLRRLFPGVLVEQEDLYVEDHNVWTSAGTASLIDLCLHLIRIDHGAIVATTIARRMVTPPHRAGNQRPYIETPLRPPDPRTSDPLQRVMNDALRHLDRRHRTAELALQAHMSERTFIRRFGNLTGTTPQKWLVHQRLLQAQHLLETTDLTVQAIAERLGFSTVGQFRKYFIAFFADTPSNYRQQFGVQMSRVPSAVSTEGNVNTRRRPGPG